MLNLEFCDRYSYPPRSKELFTEILSVIDSTKVRSVLLYGSNALGEIGVRRSDAGLEIYSDYDLLYIARKKVDRHFRMKLDKHFSRLEKKYGGNPFFHINYRYIDIDTYRKGLNNISLVTSHDGIVVFGEDLRHLMPEFNRETIDPLLHNERLIWALWRIIAFFPPELLTNRETSSQRKEWWTYAICKETLVIVMWLLPLEDVFISSYRQRKEYIERHYGELRAATFFGKDFIGLTGKCYAEKCGPGVIEDPYDLYNQAIDCFFAARNYMLSLNGIGGKKLPSDVRGEFFIDNRVQRVLYDLYLIACKSRRMNMKRAVRWYLASKYGLMFDILLDMNMALSLYLGGQFKESRARLAAADNLFRKLTLNGAFPETLGSLSFWDAWTSLRSAFSEFLSVYIPSSRSFNDRVVGRNVTNER